MSMIEHSARPGAMLPHADAHPGLGEQALRHLLFHFAPVPKQGDEAPIIISSGDGCFVTDTAGRTYVDGLAGLFTVQLGYGYGAELGEAAAQQMRELPYFSNWGYAHPPAIRLAAKLAELTPASLTRVMFMSSGSEVVESAWKIARLYFKARGERRWKVVARQNAYHGVTLGALSITGVMAARRDFEPLVPDALHVRSPDRSGRPPNESDADFCAFLLEDFRATVEAADPSTIALVIMDPVQTAGGSLVPPPGYYEGIREICDRHGILLCADEVISAFGRFGEWFASECFGIRPDMITCAKGLSSGYAAIGAIIASEEIAATLRSATVPLNHGGTFGGHPVQAAVALKNIEVLERDEVLEHVRANETTFRESLEDLLSEPFVEKINGAGYLLAVQLCDESGATLSAAEREILLKRHIAPNLLENRLICRVDDRINAILQLAPPLIAGEREFEAITTALRKSLKAVPKDWRTR